MLSFPFFCLQFFCLIVPSSIVLSNGSPPEGRANDYGHKGQAKHEDRQIIDRNIIDRKMGKDRFSQETDDSFFHDQPPQAGVGASKFMGGIAE